MFFTLSLLCLSKLHLSKNKLSLFTGILGLVLYLSFYFVYIGNFLPSNILTYIIAIDLVITVIVLNTLLVNVVETIEIEKEINDKI
jgi:uncharacterized membrane protein HdeD (DUF308 family)